MISLFLFWRSNSIETHLAKDIESAFNLESRDTGQFPLFKSVSTLRTPSKISFSWSGYHLLLGDETFSEGSSSIDVSSLSICGHWPIISKDALVPCLAEASYITKLVTPIEQPKLSSCFIINSSNFFERFIINEI